jgi:mevalonate kinase
MRAGMLLTWFYLLGDYHNPSQTRNFDKSLTYLKEMMMMSQDLSLEPVTLGSAHNSFLLFMLQQSLLVKNLDYFKSDPVFQERVSEKKYLKRVINHILYDSTSQTNKALVVNSYYTCYKLRKLLRENNIDVNKLWVSDLGLNLTQNGAGAEGNSFALRQLLG